MAAVILTLFLLLAAVPAWGGVPEELCLSCHPRHHAGHGGCSACHRGNPLAKRVNVAHQGLVVGRHARFFLKGDRTSAQGEILVQRLGCRRCHVIAGTGNRLAASLDRVAASRGSAELVAALKTPATAMPDFRLDGERIDLVITTLYATAGKGAPAGDPPLAVHFRRGEDPGTDTFSLKCGPCHRALSSRFGAVGGGATGPDLSGLFSPFYPLRATEEPWTGRRLAVWLKNPRSLRPWSVMRPVAVTSAELSALEGTLAVRPAGDRSR